MVERMKAAIINQYGRTGVLQVAEVDRPAPGPNDVIVKVKTASLNPRDWLTMRGIYQARKSLEPFPITLGSDFSGEIVQLGASVSNLKIGDEVFAMQPLSGKFGAFAEYVKVASKAVGIKPASISHEDAAAMPCAGMTSYQTLHKIASVQPGETVLVNGASGGVGVYAVQIAKALGAHVIAVCSPDNAQLCKDLGADEVINYKADNFENAVSAYDVVYDVIGRSSPKKTKASLKLGGCYITTIPSVKTAAAAAGSWLTARILPGSYKTSHLVIVKPEPSDLTAMADMITAGALRTIIDSRYDLANIEQAFERSQTWRARGKIIINIG